MGTMRRINSCLAILPYLLLTWLFFNGISHAADTLKAGEVMKDWQSLYSPGGIFRLEFFVPDFSSNRYLGIRCIYVPDSPPSDVVWIANREDPLMDTSGVLNMTQDGKLVITDSRGISVTINSEQPATSSNTSVILLDSGNLVIKEGERIVWQSFDYPQDTFLVGMKLGMFDLKMGRPYNRSLTSWLSPQAAVQGAFTLGVDPNNTKQLVIWRRGALYWRSGIWNGSTFSNLADDYNIFENFNFSYLSNENESYFTFTVIDDTGSWIKMSSSGQIERRVSQFGDSSTVPLDTCDGDVNETRLKGCVTPKPSGCSGGDMFSPLTGDVYGEFEFLYNSSMGLSDCREICLRNCSCNAYASSWSNGTGCIFAFGQNKNDGYPSAQYYSRNNGLDSPHILGSEDRPRKTQLWSIVGSLTTFTVVSILCYLGWKRCCFRGKNENGHDSINQNTDTELFMHKVGTSTAAIDELSGAHKLELSGKKVAVKGWGFTRDKGEKGRSGTRGWKDDATGSRVKECMKESK
ncbi:hypothetical protein L1049_027262 [Liquidambar formosana]|uniref:Uncharacterized protein n=1 Tax=Liquidambar formosana TaxID=63359 RepID=A0AAP0N7G3_LIQFO